MKDRIIKTLAFGGVVCGALTFLTMIVYALIVNFGWITIPIVVIFAWVIWGIAYLFNRYD